MCSGYQKQNHPIHSCPLTTQPLAHPKQHPVLQTHSRWELYRGVLHCIIHTVFSLYLFHIWIYKLRHLHSCTVFSAWIFCTRRSFRSSKSHLLPYTCSRLDSQGLWNSTCWCSSNNTTQWCTLQKVPSVKPCTTVFWNFKFRMNLESSLESTRFCSSVFRDPHGRRITD